MKYSANVLGYVVLAMTAAWAGASPCLAEESNDLCVNATAVGEGTFTGDSRDARTDGGVRAPCGSFAFDVSAQISVSAATSGPIADDAGVFNKNRKISADGVAKSHSITILQPSADMGTLRYHPGETIAIRWKSTGAIANVRIDLLYDPSAGGNPAIAASVSLVAS